MKQIGFDRAGAVRYARKWALARNPAYCDFENYNLGGDCTNFVSQCLQAGGAHTNVKEGWFCNNLNSRGPAWTGVEQLYNFLVTNKGIGPYGALTDLSQVQAGDIIQLSFDGKQFSHSLFVTSVNAETSGKKSVLVCTHTFDYLDRPLSTYFYSTLRVIRIEGVRTP